MCLFYTRASPAVAFQNACREKRPCKDPNLQSSPSLFTILIVLYQASFLLLSFFDFEVRVKLFIQISLPPAAVTARPTPPPPELIEEVLTCHFPSFSLPKQSHETGWEKGFVIGVGGYRGRGSWAGALHFFFLKWKLFIAIPAAWV